MTLPDISTLSTLGLGAGLAALAAGWSQVKSFLGRLAGVFIVTVELRDRAAESARAYTRKYLRATPTAFRYYFGTIEFIRPRARHGVVVYEELGERGRIFWQGLRPLWAQITRKEGRGASERVVLRYVRGMFDADQLVLDMANRGQSVSAENAQMDRFRVYRLAGRSGKARELRNEGVGSKSEPPSAVTENGADYGRLVGWGADEVGEVVPRTNPIDRLSLTPTVERSVAEIRRWFESKDWYADRQIPWRFGLGLRGPPGTGKSSLVKAIGQTLKIPIFLMDIATMDNQEFHEGYQRALSSAPCIVLIEDIDAVFHGRTNVVAEKGQGLTFDCLLNTISGVESSDGVLLIVTTNNPEHVDPALGVPQPGSMSTRPGRIDRAVEMPVLTAEGRRKLARRILSGCHESWVEHLVEAGDFDTGAQFEDRCATAALNLYWSEDPGKPAPSAEARAA